jgi:hypothetical protein
VERNVCGVKSKKEKEMDYQKIQKLYKNEATVNTVLSECDDMFKMVDGIGSAFLSKKVDTLQAVYNALQELNGIYSYLNIVYSIASTEEEVIEAQRYLAIRDDKENKSTVDDAKRRSTVEIATFSSVRNLIEGYVKVTERLIGSCQSMLKKFEIESNIKS